jgi:hypothetical protein
MPLTFDTEVCARLQECMDDFRLEVAVKDDKFWTVLGDLIDDLEVNCAT